MVHPGLSFRSGLGRDPVNFSLLWMPIALRHARIGWPVNPVSSSRSADVIGPRSRASVSARCFGAGAVVVRGFPSGFSPATSSASGRTPRRWRWGGQGHAGPVIH